MVSVSHHITWRLGIRFPEAIPLIYVVGYPKTGTTWACQLVADYLQLPFPRLSLLPVGFPAVVHGHEPVRREYPRCIYVMRDGRDALASLYFHLCRGIPSGDRPRLTRWQRRALPGLVDKDDVKKNFAPFVAAQMKRTHGSRLHWGDHVRSYLDAVHPHVGLLRYEDLLDDGAATLARAIRDMSGGPADLDRAAASVDKFSFENQARRRAGEEDRGSFLRRGTSGDWVHHFTREAAEIFDRACGEELVATGYEPDRSWVERVEG